MTPPSSDAAGPPAPAPVEISPHLRSRLLATSGWARFVAIAGFVLAGLTGLASIGMEIMLLRTGGESPRFARMLAPIAVALVVAAAAAALTWAYGRNASAYLVLGEPALTRAFRNLRRLVKLSTMMLALTTGLKVVSVLAVLF